jgi:hypothetical protein
VALGIALGFASPLAQSQPSPALTLAERLQRQYEADEAAVAAYLAANPGVQRETIKDGVLHRIQRIGSNGKPIYIKSRAGNVSIKSNVESGALIKADSLYAGGSVGYNITGTGMTAGVWEPGLPRTTHELLSGKVSIAAGQTGSADDHATHVTGTIVGKSGLTGQGASARGIAFNANAINYNADNDISEMLAARDAGGKKLPVTNHSYGYANDNTTPLWQFGAYDDVAANWDEVIVSLVDSQPFVAAGNEQQTSGNPSKNGYDLMTGASAAKNVVTVGAVNADKTISSYTNFGPTDDGRLKPEIVARGTGINSAQAGSDTAYSGNGDASSGTSYATPAAAAGALLLQQFFESRYERRMKAATLRALIFGTAQDLGRPGPDHQFGWGLMDVEKAANTIKQSTFTLLGSSTAAQQRGALMVEFTTNPTPISGGTLTNASEWLTTSKTLFGVVIAKGGEPLVVNIAWDDDRGAVQTAADGIDPTTNRGVYDFDLYVERLDSSPEPKRFAWQIPSMTNRQDAAAPAADTFQQRGHNFKQVFIASPATGGRYAIYIGKHTSSPSAVKPLSLVVTGMASTNGAPQLRRVVRTGTAQEGALQTGAYDYWDQEDDPEGTSTFRWKKAPFITNRGVERVNPAAATIISGATGRTYTPTSADVNFGLSFCVTGVATQGSTTASEVCSDFSAKVAAAPFTNGACGTANSVAIGSAPTANLCSAGVASVVGTASGQWAWTCNGFSGGANASCTAPVLSGEDSAPGLNTTGLTGVTGDGNGDGIADSSQTAVNSAQLRLTNAISTNPTANPAFVTVVAGGSNGKANSSTAVVNSVSQADAPATVPAGMVTPLGLVKIKASGPTNANQTVSIYIDNTVTANGYWIRNAAGVWVNLASSARGGAVVSEGNKTRLDISVQDGGPFDSDNTSASIELNGVVGQMPQSSTAYKPKLGASQTTVPF